MPLRDGSAGAVPKHVVGEDLDAHAALSTDPQPLDRRLEFLPSFHTATLPTCVRAA
jgi:hypothetical protein